MRAATRMAAGAVAALAFGGLAATGAHADPTPSPQAETCRYVVESDAPVRSGPGRQHEERGLLEASDQPISATCASRGRGSDHWVRLQAGDYGGLWLWRNRLEPAEEDD